MNKEKVIVIGTGKEAEAFLYNYRNVYEVVLFADDNPRRHVFRGKSVVVLESIIYQMDTRYKIIIATPEEEYINISRRLNRYNLREFENYIYYKAIGKQVAIFMGNCQSQDLKFFMENIKEFTKEYWIYPYPAIQDADAWYMPKEILHNCSVLIYQGVKEETNGLLHSSDYMVNTVCERGGRAIRLPNLFKCGNGWYPQSLKKRIPLMRNAEIEFVVNSDNHDSIIRKLSENGMDVETISDTIINGDVWSKQEIVDNFDKYMRKIEIEDEKCDIKIYDYIRKNYKEKLIFTDSGHISNDVFIEYIIQLMDLIGIKLVTDLSECMSLRRITQDMPIYGCVARALELEYVNDNQIIKENSFSLTEEGLDIKEYVKQYLYMCVNSTYI